MRLVKSFCTLLLLVIVKTICVAQSEATVVYIEQYRKIAVQEMKRTGIPASITLAQGILESNSGTSTLAKNYNNHFGIKCKTDWKGETTYQDDDAKNECFRVYPNAAASYADHSNFLKNRPNYANLFLLDPLDDSAWAYGLKKAGYATAPDYARKLLKVIDDYELSQYNFPELDDEDESSAPVIEKKEINLKDSLTKTTTVLNDTAKKIEAVKATKPIEPAISDTTQIQLNNIKGINVSNEPTTLNDIPKANSLPVEKEIMVVDSIKKETPKKDTVYKKEIPAAQKQINIPKGIFKINGTAVIWSLSGTSYLAIANQYHIPLFKLFEYNDLHETDLVENDQLVFLEMKKKTGAKSLHTAKEGETLYSISQTEAIQLAYLSLYNPTLVNIPLKEGTIVYLFKQKEEPAPSTESIKPILKPKSNLFNKLFKN